MNRVTLSAAIDRSAHQREIKEDLRVLFGTDDLDRIDAARLYLFAREVLPVIDPTIFEDGGGGHGID